MAEPLTFRPAASAPRHYGVGMPLGTSLRTGLTVIALLLAGCAGRVGATTSPSPSSGPSRPPLTEELSGGTPVQLGSAGHWAIAAGQAFVGAQDGVTALDLASGRTVWQASFGAGEGWEGPPQIGLSDNRSTVVAVRTVTVAGASRLNLLVLNAATGAVVADQLLTDPDGRWVVDLPPRVLAADAETIVLTADPESGVQTGVVRAADGTLAWQVREQAVAAGPGSVVTRSGGWSRTDGVRRWRAAGPLGPLLAQRAGVIVAGLGTAAVWLDPALGLEIARTEKLAEAEPPCAPASDVLVCLGGGVAGYDLANGRQLWSSSAPAVSIAMIGDWAYLARRDGRGDVLDARTGQVLVADVPLPPIRYADGIGVLLGADNGYRWVPLIR